MSRLPSERCPNAAAVDDPADADRFARELEGAARVLRAFLRRMCRCERDAEDVLQETLSRAWRYRSSFDRSRELVPWLNRCGLRVWLDLRRSRARDPHLLGADDQSLVDPRRHDAIESRDEIAAVIARLGPVERDILMRHHVDGELVREIAIALDMPENTVKSHLRRAREKLAGGHDEV